MKNNLFLLLLIISAFISCQKNKTKIATLMYNKEIDFGTIKANDTVNTVFNLKNTSANPLKIKQIKTSCGCTVATLKDSTLEENKTTNIEVQYIANKGTTGRISKSIIIDANTNPNFTVFYLKGNVVDK